MSVYAGQEIRFSHEGHDFIAEISHGDIAGFPWEEFDGHVNVRKVSHDYGTLYGESKSPGERIIYRGDRREYSFVVDIPAAIAVATREGWSFGEGTKKQRVAAAVEEDIKSCSGYISGDWEYVCVSVTMVDDDGEPMSEPEILGGCESFGDYVESEIIYELAAECISNTVHVIGGAQ